MWGHCQNDKKKIYIYIFSKILLKLITTNDCGTDGL